MLATLVLAAAVAHAQVPSTDIWLAPLTVRNGVTEVGTPINVTARAGYDNQPNFSSDGRHLYFTTQRDGQTDIHRYDVRSKRTSPVTSSPESEYSAVQIPGTRDLAMIVVERDSTQRLWRLAPDGTREVLLPQLKPVGYHAWADARTVLAFVLGSPNAAVLADIRTQKADTIARDIGRSLGRDPRTGTLTWTQRPADAPFTNLREIQLPSRRTSDLTSGLPGSQDYAWASDGRLFMASGRRISVKRPGGEWAPISNFTDSMIGAITRLAVSPRADMLAFVAEEGPRKPPALPADPPPRPSADAASMSATASRAGALAVIVVRHAEKAAGTGDVDISEIGQARARALASALEDANVRAVVTSSLKRTQQTAEPLAKALGLDMQTVDIGGGMAAHVRRVVETVRKTPEGAVLVVGHSNTVPAIIAALGGPRLADLCESVYNDLFVLTLPASGPVSLVHGTFGEVTLPAPNCVGMKP